MSLKALLATPTKPMEVSLYSKSRSQTDTSTGTFPRAVLPWHEFPKAVNDYIAGVEDTEPIFNQVDDIRYKVM